MDDRSTSPIEKKYRHSESVHRSGSPMPSKVRHSLPSKRSPSVQDHRNIYDDVVQKLYSGPKFVGGLDVQVSLLSPASVRSDLVTREINPDHLKTLKVSLSSFPAGLHTRGAFKLAVIDTPGCALSPSAIRERVMALKELNQKSLVGAMLDLNHDGVLFLTVGGNHSRQAVLELADENKGDFKLHTRVRCDFFLELDQVEITALGVVDNIVSSTSKDLGLHEKVELVRRLWKDPNMVEPHKKGYRLIPDAENQAVCGILHSNQFKGDSKNRIKQSNPFLQACNVPDVHWDIVFKLLRKGTMKQKAFRNMSWTLPEQGLSGVAKLLQNRRQARFQKRIGCPETI